MSDSYSGVNPLDALAEEFVSRHRRGENPSVSEYAQKHPELAEDIRDLFPGLVLMEAVRPKPGTATTPVLAVAAGAGPKRLGDYRLLREVGRGGMGIVYEAEQLSLGRHVALKVLPAAGLMAPTFLERFRREAKAAARLHHTNIVPVYGVGEANGVHFFTMQFIQGQSLDQVLHDVRRLRKRSEDKSTAADPTRTRVEDSVAQGLLTGQFEIEPAALAAGPDASGENAPPTAALAAERGSAEVRMPTGLSAGNSEMQYFRSVAHIGLQAADALAYAHRQGILHRDVKPSNLLLDQQGTVWITDFGLAKAEGSEELTRTGDIVGTVRFMAPERFDGRSLPQSDVYSLGLTLYEMLTLRPAFNALSRAQLIEKVLHQLPATPRRIDANVPRDLETIVLKCLVKDPQDRYPNAEALADDLRRFLSDRPIWARRASSAERAWRWCRRNPVVANLLTMVAVLLVTIAVRSTFFAARLQTALTRIEKAEREARLREAEALVGQAHGTRYSHRPGQRFDALAALHKAANIGRELEQPPQWFDRLRNEAIAALALADIDITQTWDGFPPGTHRAEVSHDFELYARTTRKGACSIRCIANDREIARLSELGCPATATFGPRRQLLLQGEAGGCLQLWDLSERKPILRLEQFQTVLHGHSFNSDGKLLLVSFADGSLRAYATDTGACRYRLSPKEITKECQCQLHPTEPFAATYSYWTNLLQVRDLRTGEVRIARKLPWRGSGLGAWSPDGRTLAAADGDSARVNLYAFDPASPSLRLTRELKAPGKGGTRVRFNPAGDRVATRGWEGVVHLFDTVNGRLLFSTHSLPASSWSDLQFDRSGGRLAAARVGDQQHQIGAWSVADAREYRALLLRSTERRYPDALPAVHPGGRLVALGLTNGLALFDLQSGCEVEFVPIRGGGGSSCFDGVGNLLTNSWAGLFRWPVHLDSTQPGRMTFGPPERLPFPASDHCLAASSDGRVVVQANYRWSHAGGGGRVLHPNASQSRRIRTDRCYWADVSPDGRWVVFGPASEQTVKVYESATGRCVWQSPECDPEVCSRFSPDGRWLLTTHDGGRIYSVGDWQPGAQLGPGVPWDISADSRLVVLAQSDAVYRLVELATGRELARLEDPEQIATTAAFTPDGSRLIVPAEDGLRVWDLRRIRAELGKLGLDWDAPPYPKENGEVAETLEVKIVGADALIPSDPAVLNELAWRMVSGPADQRDPVHALKFIQEALKRNPDEAYFLNTLGVAQYRNGQYAAAAATLEKSLRAGKGQADAFDLLFLAMCHAKLGSSDKAKDCFDRALAWWQGKKDLLDHHVQELKAFRAEAEAVLGLK